MLSAVIIFILILSLLVFVHELGHFWFARLFGVKAEEFGFGFPPRIGGFVKNDEGKWQYVPGKSKQEFKNTIYSINWIPIGGFVRIKGEDGANPEATDSFGNKKIWKRAVILSAGVGMNVVIAAVILSFGFLLGLPSVTEDLPPSAHVRDEQIQVFTILEGSPADTAGVETGDIILNIDEQEFSETQEVQNYIRENKDNEITLKISRQGEEVITSLTPKYLKETESHGIGVGLAEIGIVSYPAHLAVIRGVEATYYLTERITVAFYELFKNLIVKQEVAVDLSGPVGIAVMTGKFARMGFAYLIQFAALLSINLAIINFLPFPALDGGRVLFLLIEKIRRKPMNQKVEAIIHNTGFLILMALVLLVTFRDIARVSGNIINGLKSLIGM